MLFISKLGVAVSWLLLAVTVAAAPAHPLDTRGVVNTASLARSQPAHDVLVASEPLAAREVVGVNVERRTHERLHPVTRGTKETTAPDGPAVQDPSVAQPGGPRRRATQNEPLARSHLLHDTIVVSEPLVAREIVDVEAERRQHELTHQVTRADTNSAATPATPPEHPAPKSMYPPGEDGGVNIHGREFKSIHEPGDGGADGLHGRGIRREFKSIHEPGDGGADGLHGRGIRREFKSIHEPGDGGADGQHGRREFKSVHEPGDGGADGLHGRRARADE